MRNVATQVLTHLRVRNLLTITPRALPGSSSIKIWNYDCIKHGGHTVFRIYNPQTLYRVNIFHSAAIHTNQNPLRPEPLELWYRPVLVLYRAIVIIAEVTMLSFWHFMEGDIKKRAQKLRRSLIRLGPFYIKLGQALSTRPDILPAAYCSELSKLQDQIPPFPTKKALKFLQAELGAPASMLFAEISKEPLAAASLGQVYKARLHSGEWVAVKVRRPGVPERLALDAQLLNLIGGRLQTLVGAHGDIAAVVNEVVAHMLQETDYIHEGRNAERFANLYGIDAVEHRHSEDLLSEGAKKKKRAKEELVKVPKVYWEYTSNGVLTMEWIDGIKLTNKIELSKLNFDLQALVDQGVFCSLRQLLEDGFFHADPHPGNLVVTKEGVLAYFDFGMMSDFPRHYRIGLIRTLVHFVNRDSEGLAKDFLLLGFIPEGMDLHPVANALRDSFGDERSKAQLDFQGIMRQLSDVMYEFNFRLPPEFGLVIRALGSLEGTATTLDPEFRVIESAYPFIVGRLLSDSDPEMRLILQELLIRNNGSIRWHRLERLVLAISGDPNSSSKARESAGVRSASFDVRAVACAADDLITYILSEKGVRVRILLVKDIVNALDALIKESIWDSYNIASAPSPPPPQEEEDRTAEKAHSRDQNSSQPSNPFYRRFTWTSWRRSSTENQSKKKKKETNYAKSTPPPEVKELRGRLSVGMRSFLKSIEAAPEVWTPLLVKVAMNSEAQKLVVSIICASIESYHRQSSEANFFFWSQKLHRNRV